jgi:predicted peroxiredoxin
MNDNKASNNKMSDNRMSEDLIEMVKPSGVKVFVNNDSLQTALGLKWKKTSDVSVEPPKQKTSK